MNFVTHERMTTNTRPLTLDDSCPEGEYNEETLLMFLEKMEPTVEDIKRQLTDEELKDLCIRHKCRVKAYRYNPVFDYKIFLKKEGILDCRSTQSELRHLAKAVNRYKQTIMYDEEKVKKAREIEWRIRKKDSILSLDFWAYQRETPQTNNQELETVEMAKTERKIVPEGQQQQLPESLENIKFHPVLSEEPQLPVLVAGTTTASTQRVNQALNVKLFDDEEETELSNTIDDADVCPVFDIDTESMTICDSEESEGRLLSQGHQNDLKSQEVFQKDYEEFGIPPTSSQSQN